METDKQKNRGQDNASSMTIRERIAISALQGYNARPDPSPLLNKDKYAKAARDADKLLDILSKPLPPENKDMSIEPVRNKNATQAET